MALQNRRLRRIITHAYEKVPYYRRLFDENKIKPEDIRTRADLAAIPVSSRKDLQSTWEDMIARDINPDRLVSHQTSGYSGMPAIIRRAWLEDSILSLFRLRALYYYGLRRKDKIAGIRQIRPIHNRYNGILTHILSVLKLYRKILIDVSKTQNEIVRLLLQTCPDVLSGFSVSITDIARHIENNDLPGIHPRFVTAGAEMLTPAMRAQITRTFSAPVYNWYGSHEFGLIAWECKETGELHTCDDGLIIEILKDGRPATEDEQGEVVATSLYSYAMPFIRYRQGDMVKKGHESCRCGQPFSTIREIQGRLVDSFLLPGDRILHPNAILKLLHDAYPSIQQFQLIQERKDLVVLRIAPTAPIAPDSLEKIVASVSDCLGPNVMFKVVFVPEIRSDSSGKYRYLRSDVKPARN